MNTLKFIVASRSIRARGWDSAVAERYGPARADLERRGKTLAPLDMLIAAHALEAGAVLVTNDGAFSQAARLKVEDWTIPLEPERH